MIPVIKSQAEFHTITRKGRFIIDFYADWCGPCKNFSPIFDRYASSLAPQEIRFYKVNVDDSEDVCSEYSISAMPTFLFMANGAVLGKVLGANETAFRAKLNELGWI